MYHETRPRQPMNDTGCAGALLFTMIHLLVFVLFMTALIDWDGDQALLPLTILACYWAGALTGYDVGRR